MRKAVRLRCTIRTSTPERTCYVEPINARSMLDAATTAPSGQRQFERRRRLTPAALEVANQKVRAAYSPIVITGAVRIADFVVLSVVGIALYLAYVARLDGFAWEYITAIVAMAATAGFWFPAFRISQE